MEKNKKNQSSESSKMAIKRKNYIILAIGFAIILLGYALMVGGGSDSPDEFNYAMFSWRRITLAPILIVIGFSVEVYAIVKRY